MERNKKFKTLLFNITNKTGYQIFTFMVGYWLLINIILLIVASNIGSWLILSGFNLGFIGSLIGFSLLLLTSNWLVTSNSFKQALVFFGFIIRMIVYAFIVLLVIFFNFANIIALIIGFSTLMIAIITSQLIKLIISKRQKKEK